MIRVKPESAEDRQKILDYCEGHKVYVVNERDVKDCVVIDIEAGTPQATALITGFKTNAGAKLKVMKEDMDILKKMLDQPVELTEATKPTFNEAVEIIKTLVRFADKNNSINLRGDLAKAVGDAREFVSRL